VSAYREAHATCENHPGVVAARICRKCDEPLCEPCCAFVVNDDVWCASCGAELQGEGQGARVVGWTSVGVGLALLCALLMTASARWGGAGIYFVSAALVVTVVMVSQFLRVMRMRMGPHVAHTPRMYRRKPGDALPVPWGIGAREATPGSVSARADRRHA